MATKKRRSDVGQMSKEDYEAISERPSYEAPPSTNESQFLSASEMANRRTIRVQRPATSEGIRLPVAPSPAQPAAGNPFAKIKLSAPSITDTAKPFAFLPASSTTKPTPAAAPFSAIPKTTASLVSPESQAYKAALIAQDKEFIKLMTEADLGSANQSNVLWQYMYYRSEVDFKYQSTGANKRIKPSAPAAPPATPAAPPAAAPAPFSFGTTSTSAPSSTSAAPSSSAPKAPSFNFGAPTAAIASSTPATGFALSVPAASTNSPTASGGGFSFNKSAAPAITPPGDQIAASESNDTPTAGNTTFPDEDKQDGVRKTEDKDWDNIEEFGPIRVYHKEHPKEKDSPLANFASGAVVLQVKKDDPKAHRMLMRGSHGLKVVVNMMIKHDMTFLFQTQQSQKGKAFGLISFTGINDRDRGIEIFKMKGVEDVAKSLHQKLEELAKKSK